MFIVVRLLQYEAFNKDLKDEQLSIVFGPNYLISFLEGNEDIFKSVKDRLHQGSQRIRSQGSDYLAYTLLDTIVDHYFIVLEKVDINLDELEEELMHLPNPAILHKIQYAKRDMIILRKAIWPMRDVVNRFLRLESSLVQSKQRNFTYKIFMIILYK